MPKKNKVSEAKILKATILAHLIVDKGLHFDFSKDKELERLTAVAVESLMSFDSAHGSKKSRRWKGRLRLRRLKR